MDKLVERTGEAIIKQSVSRYEIGIMHPQRNTMMALSKTLCISEGYFKGINMKIKDLKELYGTSIATQVHEAWDLHIILRESTMIGGITKVSIKITRN